jgi:hypothetical protein
MDAYTVPRADYTANLTTPYTLDNLLKGGYTLANVDDFVHDGRISEALANEFFQVWVVGKCEFRWNAELQQPEEAIYPRQHYADEPPTWRRMSWG